MSNAINLFDFEVKGDLTGVNSSGRYGGGIQWQNTDVSANTIADLRTSLVNNNYEDMGADIGNSTGQLSFSAAGGAPLTVTYSGAATTGDFFAYGTATKYDYSSIFPYHKEFPYKYESRAAINSLTITTTTTGQKSLMPIGKLFSCCRNIKAPLFCLR
jgi:hypothetical protein